MGLSSTEKGNPNIAYKEVYAAAIEAGFMPTAHAGVHLAEVSGHRVLRTSGMVLWRQSARY